MRILLPFLLLVSSLSAKEEPEGYSGITMPERAIAQKMMVVSSNRLASEAGLAVLLKGGNALDAAIATQAVLNLVEPQSSGIGGGGFLLYYRAKDGMIKVYDGRETAPCVPLSYEVGVPGLVAMLELAHREEGFAPWESLFDGAIALAEQGFPLSKRLHHLLLEPSQLTENEQLQGYLFEESKPKPVGTHLKNPSLANTFRALAKEGGAYFYRGELADKIVEATDNSVSHSDLLHYNPIVRKPLIAFYKGYKIATTPPPGGGVTPLQILRILEEKNYEKEEWKEVTFIRDFAHASRLAYADRRYYLADPAFIPIPLDALLNKHYLQYRAQLALDQKRPPPPGLWPAHSIQYYPHLGNEKREPLSTAQICVIDDQGNMVSLTSSIGDAFGSGLFVAGFFLNNHLADFSSYPNWKGKEIANGISHGKRPRSAMAPLFVFDKKSGAPVLLLGSAGGERIGEYLAQALLLVFEFGLSLQEAVTAPHYVSMDDEIELEKRTFLEKEKSSLEALGYIVSLRTHTSGTQGIQISSTGLQGAIDPRREGYASGL